MKQLLILALLLVVAAGAAVGFQGDSQEQLRQPADGQLARAVDKLQKELQALRADVDYLLVSENYNKEEIGYLEELVQLREETYKTVFLGWKMGTKPSFDEASARYHLHLARAQLAGAKNDMGQCQEEWKATVLAAEREINTMRISYEAGKVSLGRVMEAQAQLAEAQLNLSKMKRKAAWKENRP